MYEASTRSLQVNQRCRTDLKSFSFQCDTFPGSGMQISWNMSLAPCLRAGICAYCGVSSPRLLFAKHFGGKPTLSIWTQYTSAQLCKTHRKMKTSPATGWGAKRSWALNSSRPVKSSGTCTPSIIFCMSCTTILRFPYRRASVVAMCP